jgi:hypothetical protein
MTELMPDFNYSEKAKSIKHFEFFHDIIVAYTKHITYGVVIIKCKKYLTTSPKITTID